MSELAGVEVGSTIICNSYSCADELFKVERITKTLAVCSDGSSFQLDTGLKRGTGGSYFSRYGRVATVAEIEQVALSLRIRRAAATLEKLRVTISNLDAVEALIAADAAARKDVQ